MPIWVIVNHVTFSLSLLASFNFEKEVWDSHFGLQCAASPWKFQWTEFEVLFLSLRFSSHLSFWYCFFSALYVFSWACYFNLLCFVFTRVKRMHSFPNKICNTKNAPQYVDIVGEVSVCFCRFQCYLVAFLRVYLSAWSLYWIHLTIMQVWVQIILVGELVTTRVWRAYTYSKAGYSCASFGMICY